MMKMMVKTRYRQDDIPCTVTPDSNGNLTVIFDEPQKAVTPGQSAVFYIEDTCLGGGIIEGYLVDNEVKTFPANFAKAEG
jgi:tRNA-specific 2-thiouridylase